jgi:tetratricopeptide (TPR) repeat protein
VITDLETRSEIDNELALYNKLGDLYLKAGRVADAVETYEKAANRYAESGFPNNAIALCNKVLRNAPGRTPMYLKLAKLMLERGFATEAKRNLLEYAERMQRAGQLEQAFTALKEFADLSPDNEEIRLLLAEQLKAAARTDEAREQLSKLYAEVEATGDHRKTRATLDKMRVIDPDYDVEAAPKPKVERRKKTSDLIFLDLDEPAPAAAAPEVEMPVETPVEPPFVEPTPEPAPQAPAAEEEEREEPAAAKAAAERELELEPTSLEEETAEALASAYKSLDIEPTSLVEGVDETDVDVDRITSEYAEPEAEVPAVDGLDVETEFEAPGEAEIPTLDVEPTVLEAADVPETAPEAVEEEEVEAAPPEIEPAVEEPAMDVEERAELEAVSGEEEPVEPEEAPAAPSEEELEDRDLVVEVEEHTVEVLESKGRDSLGIEDDAVWDDSEAGALEVPELDLGGFDEEVAEHEQEPAALEGVPTLDLHEEDIAAEIEEEGRDAEPEELAESVEPAVGAEPVEEETAPPDVAGLEAMVADDPENAELHRGLAEALIETGERERGLEELEIAQRLFESSEEWRAADGVVREILRLEPNSVRHHQKRVELAFHRGDKAALADAYLGLGDALLREGATERARAVYQRVLEHDPDSEGARLGLVTLEPEEETVEEGVAPAAPAAATGSPLDDEFVDLGALILEDEQMRVMDTRMRIEDEEPTGDEQRDFEEMLSEFKRGIEANLAEEDWEAHYDLGVAFKEMGLLDEAITEFQKALRAPEGRLKTAEALGLCFYDKAQHSVAATVLRRAVDSESGGDEAKIGLLYWLGRCEEELGRTEEALGHYQRVFSIDVGFEDVEERVRQLAEPGR